MPSSPKPTHATTRLQGRRRPGTISATAADPDPLDLAAYGSQPLGVEGFALRLKARAVRLAPREPRFRLVLRQRPALLDLLAEGVLSKPVAAETIDQHRRQPLGQGGHCATLKFWECPMRR